MKSTKDLGMMPEEKYLITGFSGFVGRHFCEYLERNNVSAYIKGIDVRQHDIKLDDYSNIRIDFEKIDLLSENEVEKLISNFKPKFILHLASFSSVAFSWKEPILSFRNNTNIFLNILEAVRKYSSKTRVLSIGSSDEYGNIRGENIRLEESHPLNPISPYAVARVSQELLSKIYVNSYGLDIVLTRSFNHIGPSQTDVFVISAFARQLIKMKKMNCLNGKLVTGDVSIIRDFIDVRDVVSAYYLLLHSGEKGETYNVCSGQGMSLREIISIMADVLNMKVTITIDEKLIRPNDIKKIVGHNEKIQQTLGWKPKFTLRQSLCDVLDYWDSIL